MAINLKVPRTKELRPRITVLGVGGAGGNAVNNMIEAGLEGVDFVVANTDAQALAQSKAERRIQLGATTTEGLGAGAQPDVGRAGAEESLPEIMEQLQGPHGVHHRRHGRRHRHRRSPGHRPRGARGGHPDRRRGHQAFRPGRRPPHAGGRSAASSSCSTSSIP